MGVIGGVVGTQILRTISPGHRRRSNASPYAGRSKVEILLGKGIWEQIRGRKVMDFGCGTGSEAIELAQRGARHVYGIDIQECWLKIAREQAGKAGCSNVSFAQRAVERVDLIISIDAFEHFADPAAILNVMADLLLPDGYVLAAFGPTWYHPRGGHLFSVFPWSHLIFTERALCRWRSDFREDGAQKFSEVEGGLNQMTIGRFEELVEHSRFQIDSLQTIPIRSADMFHNTLTREFLTASVRCKLSLKKDV
jgi:SAM-dependent methyltransferase